MSSPENKPAPSPPEPDYGLGPDTWPWPTEGGTYLRDKTTGALTKQEESRAGA